MLTRKRLLAAVKYPTRYDDRWREESWPVIRFTTDQMSELKLGDRISVDVGKARQSRIYVVDSITHTPEGGTNISAHMPILGDAPGEKTYDVLLGPPKGRVGFFSNDGPAPKTASCP